MANNARPGIRWRSSEGILPIATVKLTVSPAENYRSKELPGVALRS